MATSLELFVNEQKKKSEGLGISGASLPSLGDIRSKLSSFSSFSLGSSNADTEPLVEGESNRGMLANGKNRKGGNGWFSSDESVFGLSRTQRLFAFFLFNLGALFCFTTSMFLLPVLLLQTRKFAALNTLASLMLLSSFVFVWGPMTYLSHMWSANRRILTVCYVSSLFATLYSSLWLRSVVFTIIASSFQAVSLLCFVMAAVPGGERGLRMMASLFSRLLKRQSSTVLPI